MKMLVLVLVLVLVSLLVSPGLSLDCYVCSSSPTNEQCNQNTQECQAPLDTCMTIVDTLGTVKAIVKQCASRSTCSGAAATASVDSNGDGNTVNCCSSFNLCNFSKGQSINVHASVLLLTAAACLLLSF
ncbi:prostate stem cell antigen-like [Scomber scombrus]|uniref:Prostate stem cell antigen-like n=1 Tax=Scomber scombrus TaxID=13677 RepID=A0AAV1P7A0_SCOSC